MDDRDNLKFILILVLPTVVVVLYVLKWCLFLERLLDEYQKPRCAPPPPHKCQLNFQDPVTDYMEGVLSLNRHFLVLEVLIVCLIGWLLLSILVMYHTKTIRKVLAFFHANVYESGSDRGILNHLMALLKPSTVLLYSLQSECVTDVLVKIVGHQWYWHYEVAENLLCLPEQITYFYTYHLVDEFQCLDKSGIKRDLGSDRRLVFPAGSQVKMAVSGVDVLHSRTGPSFGVKVDCVPRAGQVLCTSL